MLFFGFVQFLGAIDGALFLRFANENHAFALRELGAQLGSELTFTLSFFEGDQRDLMIFHELLDRLDESPGHRLHSVSGQDFRFPLLPNEVQPALQNLQPSHDDVQLHPVDGLRFQNYVVIQHFRDGLWQLRLRLRLRGAFTAGSPDGRFGFSLCRSMHFGMLVGRVIVCD